MTQATNPVPSSQLLDVSKLSVEAAVQKLVDHAVGLGASDLFFATNEQHVAVQVRHLGAVRLVSILSSEQGKHCVAHIKAMAGMDMAEKRHPSDGRWIYNKDDGHSVDLRINVIPTMYGEDFAIRLLDRSTGLFPLENLGMTSQQLDQYRSMLSSPAGLVLITGPTGSGKSATLYASLAFLRDSQRKINTIEDPIEFALDGLRQSQVNPAIELGFADLLRGVLRQSPDIIMIGEIRDIETARTAVHAANSGILVFATLHAPGAAGAIQSMLNLGVHPHFLSTSLRGVVAQRLVRTLCPKCRVSFDLTGLPYTFDEIRPWLNDGEGNALYAPKGCEACQMAGYAGRTGVFEVMPISPALRELIAAARPGHDIHAQAVAEKMLEFRQAAMLKVARGLTSTEEIFRVAPAEHLLGEDDKEETVAEPVG